MEGLDIDKKTKEGKILGALVDILDDICEEVEDLSDEMREAWDVIDEIDEDLKELEEEVFCECEDNCCNEYFCVRCPKCGSEHYMKYEDLTEDELEDNAIKCPNCKSKIDLDECLICDEDDFEGCGCGCGHEDCSCDDCDCDCEH